VLTPAALPFGRGNLRYLAEKERIMYVMEGGMAVTISDD
jgi:hypothetical protein